MLWLSGLSMRFGTNHWMVDESTRTASGVVEEPARSVQPVEGSQRRDFTIVWVLFCAQASRMSPLWVRTAVGDLSGPGESGGGGGPELTAGMLFLGIRAKVTGKLMIIPQAEAPPAIMRRGGR